MNIEEFYFNNCNKNEIFHDFLLTMLKSKWEIIKRSFEYLPISEKQFLINDLENTLDHIKPRRFPRSYRYEDKCLLLQSIKICFQNDEFKKKLLLNPLDIAIYFHEFDSCLRYDGSQPMCYYDFLEPLIKNIIKK